MADILTKLLLMNSEGIGIAHPQLSAPSAPTVRGKMHRRSARHTPSDVVGSKSPASLARRGLPVIEAPINP